LILGSDLFGQASPANTSHDQIIQRYPLIEQVRKQKEINTDEARATLQDLKELVGDNDPFVPPYLSLLAAEILLEENEEEEGLAKAEESRLLFEEAGNDEGLAEVYEALTQFNLRSARYPEALTFAFKALEIREKLQDDLGVANGFTEIADIYWYYQRFPESIEYGLKAVALIEKKGGSEALAGAYKILSESYLEIPDYDQALKYIEQSLVVRKSMGAGPLELASSINSRGNIYKFMDRYDDALADYTEVFEICDSANYQIGMRASLANLGHVYLLKKDYAQAIHYKLRSLEIQENSGQTQQMAENLLHLSEAYAGLGNFEEAYHNRTRYDSVTANEHSQALDKLTNELSVKYETEKKEQSIKNLSERVRLQNISLVLGAALLLISLVATLVFLRLNKKLQLRNREKEILLKEIHHRTKNNLQILSSLLSLQSDHLIDSNAIDALSEGKNRVESMGMIHQRLYTAEDITSVDMKEYLHELCRYLEDSFSAHDKHITIKDDISFGKMDVDYAIPLGLIVNELVTNSVKYAFSDRDQGEISVRLYREDLQLILVVADNGNPAQKTAIASKISTSFGSMLVTTLSKKLKGAIEIGTDDGYKTTIKFHRFET
jgi:two-component sensor histidine kinase